MRTVRGNVGAAGSLSGGGAGGERTGPRTLRTTDDELSRLVLVLSRALRAAAPRTGDEEKVDEVVEDAPGGGLEVHEEGDLHGHDDARVGDEHGHHEVPRRAHASCRVEDGKPHAPLTVLSHFPQVRMSTHPAREAREAASGRRPPSLEALELASLPRGVVGRLWCRTEVFEHALQLSVLLEYLRDVCHVEHPTKRGCNLQGQRGRGSTRRGATVWSGQGPRGMRMGVGADGALPVIYT